MLKAVKKTTGLGILAWESEKDGSFYLCPDCGEDVFLKKGLVKVPHFAHRPKATCVSASFESELHRECKNEIYQRLITRSDISSCELERSLVSVRPDISFYYKNIPVAIEVQISNLPLTTVIHRTREYGRLGVYLLWLSPFKTSLTQDRYAPTIWEKWLHAAYYGRVFYWTTHLLIAPVKFENYLLWVEEFQGSRGYYKVSKRYRTPNIEKSISLPEAFDPVHRKPWESKNISIPECKLFVGS